VTRLWISRDVRDPKPCTQKFEGVVLRLSRRTISDLLLSEEGRHEDYQRALVAYEADSPPRGDKPEPCLAYVCSMMALDRSSSRRVTLRIEGVDVAKDLYYAVCSGTFQFHCPRAARRIASALREWVQRADPELVKRWPAPEAV